MGGESGTRTRRIRGQFPGRVVLARRVFEPRVAGNLVVQDGDHCLRSLYGGQRLDFGNRGLLGFANREAPVEMNRAAIRNRAQAR